VLALELVDFVAHVYCLDHGLAWVAHLLAVQLHSQHSLEVVVLHLFALPVFLCLNAEILLVQVSYVVYEYLQITCGHEMGVTGFFEQNVENRHQNGEADENNHTDQGLRVQRCEFAEFGRGAVGLTVFENFHGVEQFARVDEVVHHWVQNFVKAGSSVHAVRNVDDGLTDLGE